MYYKNAAEIIKEQTENVERLLFLEDLRTLPQTPEVLKLIEKYEAIVFKRCMLSE